MTVARSNDTLANVFPCGAPPALSLVVAIVLACLLLPLPALASGVTAALLPDSGFVTPGSEFTLELWVTAPGDSFNAYDAAIEYDPAVLTFLQSSPLSLQEGAYMKGACGSTYQNFTGAGDSLVIAHNLLCNLVSLPGPGQLYKLRFRASGAPQWSWVRIRSLQFYQDGLFVDPAVWSDAAVGIGVPVSVPGLGPAPMETRVKVAPNPCRTAAAVVVETAVAGEQQVIICDVQGRAVRHLDRGAFAPGTRRIAWDGKDDAGLRLAPGVYRVLVETSGRITGARVALLP
jgi:hypothetical protein